MGAAPCRAGLVQGVRGGLAPPRLMKFSTAPLGEYNRLHRRRCRTARDWALTRSSLLWMLVEWGKYIGRQTRAWTAPSLCKILPSHLADDCDTPPALRARGQSCFQAESSNIYTLHDIGHQDGLIALSWKTGTASRWPSAWKRDLCKWFRYCSRGRRLAARSTRRTARA